MYDPLPPLDSINIYKRPVLKQTSRTLSDASPFSMFFQSLLPNFNVQEGGFPADAQGVAANAAVGNEAGPNNQIELHDEDAEGILSFRNDNFIVYILTKGTLDLFYLNINKAIGITNKRFVIGYRCSWTKYSAILRFKKFAYFSR